jgi:hypothetical protein
MSDPLQSQPGDKSTRLAWYQPVGVGLCLAYLVYRAGTSLFSLTTSAISIGPFSANSTISMYYWIIAFAVYSVSIYGMAAKTNWGAVLVLSWFAIRATWCLVDIGLSMGYSQEMLQIIVHENNLPSSAEHIPAIMLGMIAGKAFSLCIDSIVLWYVATRRRSLSSLQPGRPVNDKHATLRVSDIPVGMIFLCIYLIFEIGSTFLSSILRPLIIGPFEVPQPISSAVQFISLVLLGMQLFGTLRRKTWTFALILGWCVYRIILGVVSFVLSCLDIDRAATLLVKMVGPSMQLRGDWQVYLLLSVVFLSALTINTIIGWYTVSNRRYFTPQIAGESAP